MTDYAATKLTEMFVEGPDVVLRPLCALLCQVGCFLAEARVDAGKAQITLRYTGVLARFCPL
ncbi:hypothetical protein D0A38_20175 [Xanthomonas campestris pv. incanae]|nr:hypothetical protein D0A38_20175 [Xanthomonas campestris pv. incanae]